MKGSSTCNFKPLHWQKIEKRTFFQALFTWVDNYTWYANTFEFVYFQEEYSDGGIVVEDCLKLMLNLLRNNSSNQTFFREGSYIQRISLFFDLNLDQEELEVGWAAQKVSNMLYMLSVVRTLVSPSNPTQVLKSNFKLLLSKRRSLYCISRIFLHFFTSFSNPLKRKCASHFESSLRALNSGLKIIENVSFSYFDIFRQYFVLLTCLVTKLQVY